MFTKVERPCEFCGAIVLVKPAKLAEFRFCGRRCQGYHTASLFPRTSSIEISLRDAMFSLGLSFQAQHQIGPFIVDFAIPSCRLAIEADGDYWHGRPEQIKKDRRKDGYLRREGWNVLRFTESAIKADALACAKSILDHVQDRTDSAQ